MSESLLIHVPSPKAQLRLGAAAWEGAPGDPDEEGHEGIHAYTPEHTEWEIAGKIVVQATGSVILSSYESSLLFGANGGVIARTADSVEIGTAVGIKIMAGGFFPGDDERTLDGEPTDWAATLDSGLSSHSAGWTHGLDSGLALVGAALGVASFAVGSKTRDDAAMLALGLADATAGVLTNALGHAGEAAPGLAVHATGGVLMATPAFQSLYTGGGTMIGGLQVQVLGLMTAGVLAGHDASVEAIARADLSALASLTVAAPTKLELSAWSAVVLRGARIDLGCPERRPPTTSLQLNAQHIQLGDTTSYSPNSNLQLGSPAPSGPHRWAVGRMQMEAASVHIDNERFAISVSLHGVRVYAKKGGPRAEVTWKSAAIAAGADAPFVLVNQSSVSFVADDSNFVTVRKDGGEHKIVGKKINVGP